jgi:hypothetical protein
MVSIGEFDYDETVDQLIFDTCEHSPKDRYVYFQKQFLKTSRIENLVKMIIEKYKYVIIMGPNPSGSIPTVLLKKLIKKIPLYVFTEDHYSVMCSRCKMEYDSFQIIDDNDNIHEPDNKCPKCINIEQNPEEYVKYIKQYRNESENNVPSSMNKNKEPKVKIISTETLKQRRIEKRINNKINAPNMTSDQRAGVTATATTANDEPRKNKCSAKVKDRFCKKNSVNGTKYCTIHQPKKESFDHVFSL